MEPLLERAQRAAEVERAAAQDIESFASQQLAEAEASEGFATAAEGSAGGFAEAAAGAAEAATAAEAGTGALALLGEGALTTAGAVGAATGGLAVVGAGAQRGFALDGLGRSNRRRHGFRRLAAEYDH